MPPNRRRLGTESWAIIRSEPKAAITRAIVRRDLHRVLKKDVQESMSDAEIITLIQQWENEPPPQPVDPPPGAIPILAAEVGNLFIDMNAPPIDMGYIETSVRGVRTVREIAHSPARWRLQLGDLGGDYEDVTSEIANSIDQGSFNLRNYEDYDEPSDPDIELDDDPDNIDLSPRMALARRVVRASPMSVARQMVLDTLNRHRDPTDNQYVPANDPHLSNPDWLRSIWNNTVAVIRDARDLVESDEELPLDLPDLSLLPGQEPVNTPATPATRRARLGGGTPAVAPPAPSEPDEPVAFVDFGGDSDGDGESSSDDNE